ncbi:MAG TPA: hypothetical protein VEY09_03520 [Pyrinomonadaceae bacterium]|nr:hypothetical protein [Pyrinomonadaceae bacterium]
MSRAIRASVLTLLLFSSAHAGWMGNDVTGTPPPPPSAPQEEQTTDGIMPNGEPDTITETMLSVIENLLALL